MSANPEFPTPHTVGLHFLIEGARDAHGNASKTYSPALDQPGQQHSVYGWYTPASNEPLIPGHDRVITEVELLAPPGFPAVPSTVVDLPEAPAGQFEVIGDQQSYNTGPWEWMPGQVLTLRRITG